MVTKMVTQYYNLLDTHIAQNELLYCMSHALVVACRLENILSSTTLFKYKLGHGHAW